MTGHRRPTALIDDLPVDRLTLMYLNVLAAYSA